MHEDFKYLEHTADAEFIAYGKTPDEAFINAARATFNLIIDPDKVRIDTVRDVEITGDTLDNLLYDWISELLFMYEVDMLIFNKFEVHITNEDGYRLTGKAFGEKIDLQRHKISLHIKAVTYHDLRVEKINNIYEAQLLLDI